MRESAQDKDDAALPPFPRDSKRVREDIEAEIADHLASSEEELRRRGASAEDAGRISQKKFGDPKQIIRACWWIQMREEIAMRTTVVALLVLIAVSLSVLAFSSWKAQANVTTEIGLLREQLKQLSEATNRQPVQAAPTTVHIEGRVFKGTADKPIAGKRVFLYKYPSEMPFRVLQTDAQGYYNSGDLPPDHYFAFVYAKFIDGAPEPSGTYCYPVRSKACFLYTGGGKSTVDFNLDFAETKFTVRLSPELSEINDLLKGFWTGATIRIRRKSQEGRISSLQGELEFLSIGQKQAALFKGYDEDLGHPRLMFPNGDGQTSDWFASFSEFMPTTEMWLVPGEWEVALTLPGVYPKLENGKFNVKTISVNVQKESQIDLEVGLLPYSKSDVMSRIKDCQRETDRTAMMRKASEIKLQPSYTVKQSK